MTENKTLTQKLLEVQKEIGSVIKDKINPYYKSHYTDINGLLDTVKPVLNKYGLVVVQPLEGECLTTIIKDADSAETLTSTVKLPQNPDAQKQGAIITYFRRYSLQSLLSLSAEDDDGNTATGKVSNDPKQTQGYPPLKTKSEQTKEFFAKEVHNAYNKKPN